MRHRRRPLPSSRRGGSRQPLAHATEARLCSRHVRDEIELIRPRLHMVLGRLGAEYPPGRPIKITQEHACWHAGPYGSEVVVLMRPSGRNKQHLPNKGLTPQAYREQLTAIFADLLERLEHPGPDNL